jgi:gamma-glutamyltranspeptidase/glutathione hydrolase
MKIFLTSALVLLFLNLPGGDRLTGRMFATRSEVIATQGMVAASQPLAAQVGIDILKKGGSAVDAAIAVNAALGLMEPSGSGIGGDLARLFPGKRDQKNAGNRSPALDGSGLRGRMVRLARKIRPPAHA